MEKSDASVFAKAKARDSSAFEELIMPFEKLIFNICYRMTGNREDARDVSQEVWFKVFRSLNKCANYEGFKPWVCVIANNACLDFLRRKKARINPESLDDVFWGEDGTMEVQIEDKNAETPLEAVLSKERRQALVSAVNRLGPAYKAVIVYRDINGFSYEEIARITGLNIGTVKSQISRARENLRKILSNMAEQNQI
jgi:RNA polymerase sigma-70 factor (ECF subfamily)